jgi:hypothetical protein
MSDQGHRIFEVIGHPSSENILWIADGCSISIGDYGWENDVSPSLIHLTGYSRKGGTVWYANFLASEVRFVTLKPAPGTSPKDTLYVTKLPPRPTARPNPEVSFRRSPE